MGDDDRRARLLQAKLAALVAGQDGPPSGGEAEAVGGHAGAAFLRRGTAGWWLADADPERSVGPALAWADQQGVEVLHLVVDDPAPAGVVARRAAAFVDAPQVWSVDGRSLRPAVPTLHPPPRPAPEGVETLVALLEAAGVEVVVEHGEVTGEWLGLEVARIVVGADGPRLEVGVGRHDREAFTLLHGEVPRADALQAVVDAARTHRSPESEAHPLGRLVPERWLRSVVLARPSLVGAVGLAPVEPARPRDGIKDVVPAGAVSTAGEPTLVVTSVGVDLDLVAEAADLRARHQADAAAPARLVLVVPERDALPVTRRLADRLVHPAEIVTVPDHWRELR